MSVVLHGFPWDASSSYSRGPAHGPAVIRSLLFSEASSQYSLSGVDIKAEIEGYDFIELPADGSAARKAITARIARTIADAHCPISLGGDHSVTFPILCAMRDAYGPVNVLHIDAHTDLYDDFDGDPFSHASPFARALEGGCINNLIQVGLRSVGPAQRDLGQQHGVVMLGADAYDQIPYDKLGGPLYVSIDLDGLDPAYAPGVSHPEPGGLSTREVLGIIKRLRATPVGADIVEFNPEKDFNLLTGHLAARLTKELISATVVP